MSLVGPKSIALQKRAQQITPLGVNSNFRYWGEAATPYVARGKGSHMWDVDGREYIDYRMAYGPIILGHAFDEVDDAGSRAGHPTVDHGGLSFSGSKRFRVRHVQRIDVTEW